MRQTQSLSCSVSLLFLLLPLISAGTFYINQLKPHEIELRSMSETKSVVDTPKEISKDREFIKCLSKGECGLENKCSFNLMYSTSMDEKANNQDENENDDIEHDKNNQKSDISVRGHIMVIKNAMRYNITFYWDILGGNNNANNTKTGDKHNTIKSPPRSITYFDTGYYGEHTVRLYVPETSTSEGANAAAAADTKAFGENLESVQTLMTDDDNSHNSDCSRVQACRLLLNVCYGEVRKSCALYARACDNFSDEDEIAKESCIPECIYQYYNKDITSWLNIDSDMIVEYIKRGGGIKGSTIDGLCNTNPIVGLSIGLFVFIVVSIGGCYFAWVYRKSFKEVTNEQYSQLQQLQLLQYKEPYNPFADNTNTTLTSTTIQPIYNPNNQI